MPSLARLRFDRNCTDITRLFSYDPTSPKGQKKIAETEVLNKSAVVLITAFWEGYCEDLAAEALEQIVELAPTSDLLPQHLRLLVGKEILKGQNPLGVWNVADEGWRPALTARLDTLQEQRNRSLNTPKTAQIDELFESAVGIENISEHWHWQGMTVEQARRRLDRFVKLRGDIAHRGVAGRKVARKQATDYLALVKRLAARTGAHVNTVVRRVTGEALFLPPLQSVISNLTDTELLAALKSLSPRQRDVMKMRFGLKDLSDVRHGLDDRVELSTLGEVGDRLGLTRDKVRQIESQVISELRQIPRSRTKA